MATAKRKCPFEDQTTSYKEAKEEVMTNRFPKLQSHDKPQKWQKHVEAAMGYYFHVNGQKYCYVTEYQGAVLIHIRIYEENTKTGKLIPTKTGCCLRIGEWKMLLKVASEVTEQLKSIEEPDDILRRSLGSTSNWYILCGQDRNGRLAVSIRLLFPTRNQKSNEMCSTTKGITFTETEWETFVVMLEEIDNAVSNVVESFISQ